MFQQEGRWLITESINSKNIRGLGWGRGVPGHHRGGEPSRKEQNQKQRECRVGESQVGNQEAEKDLPWRSK